MGKLVMFLGWVWAITCIAGGILSGSTSFASSYLTSDITSSNTTIPVVSAIGFPEPGTIVIGEEQITYSSATSTTITGNLARPLLRGSGGTTAVAHASGTRVRSVESALINDSISYDIAILSDAAGATAFVSIPLAIFDILLSFAISPFGFLGTDLQFITYIWGICFVGMIVSFFIAVAGGRRV